MTTTDTVSLLREIISMHQSGWIAIESGGQAFTSPRFDDLMRRAETLAAPVAAIQPAGDVQAVLEMADDALTAAWSFVKDCDDIADKVNKAGIAISEILHPEVPAASAPAQPEAKGELPELPEEDGRFNFNGPDGHRVKGWDDDSMLAYGQACILADRARQAAIAQPLTAMLQQLRTARDTAQGEERSRYNRVCDALDVLIGMPQAIAQPSDLHAAIMNLPYGKEYAEWSGSTSARQAYRDGHKDARHAAAELVSAPQPPSTGNEADK